DCEGQSEASGCRACNASSRGARCSTGRRAGRSARRGPLRCAQENAEHLRSRKRPGRISEVDWIVPDVDKEVRPFDHAERVFADEPPDLRVVVTSSVVVKPGFGIPLSAGEGLATERASDLDLPEALVDVPPGPCSVGVRKQDHAPQTIDMVVSSTA